MGTQTGVHVQVSKISYQTLYVIFREWFFPGHFTLCDIPVNFAYLDSVIKCSHTPGRLRNHDLSLPSTIPLPRASASSDHFRSRLRYYLTFDTYTDALT